MKMGMKLLLIFLLIFFQGKASYSQPCIDKILNKAYQENYYTNCYIVIPVESAKYEKARLLIKSAVLQEYLTFFNSAYSNKDSVRAYLQQVIKGKKKLFFDEYIYSKNFTNIDYYLLHQKNTIDISSSVKQNSFLKKYLIGYPSEKKRYDIISTLPNPCRDYAFIVEAFYNLNYIVSEGDGSIIVAKIDCK